MLVYGRYRPTTDGWPWLTAESAASHVKQVIFPCFKIPVCSCAGQPASACLAVLTPGAPRVVKATAGGEVVLTVLHEPLPSGAYLLGELSKFVHLSPQRFAGITLGGSSPCGFRCDVGSICHHFRR